MHSIGKTTTKKIYPRVAKYILHTHATYVNIADTENEKIVFSQPLNRTLAQYAEKVGAKVLRVRNVFKEHELNQTVIQEPDKSIRQFMRKY